ncbi:SWIM zinc finger family protein [Aurantibacillus circumpalustris]|uniref:SWIM zinc finger family protein n=1 Tax=Aurantibacillus circumpalustris TaxID=3036359 RepID=UPI00295B1E8D|nr:hypothetical protein [Aurantibacillus circumpalustris]
MLTFDIKQFEQFFKERTLKKGLRLFEKGDLEFIERLPVFEFHFIVKSENLYIKKKGDKVLSYNCSCSEAKYCEHLAAALFYFQQETLGIKVRNKTEKSKTKESNQKQLINYNYIRKVESEKLEAFIRENKNQLSVTQIATFLTDKKTIGFSDVYSFRFTKQLRPYFSKKKIDQKTSDKLHAEIVKLQNQFEKEIKKKESFFYLYLAQIKALMPLFNLRFLGDEKFLFELYSDTLNKLDIIYKKGLTSEQKKDWFKTTLASVESNKELESEAFLFLIPRYVTMTKSESNLHLLNSQLKKRVFKTPYSHSFDKLLIARFEVALVEWKLFKIAFPLHYEGGMVELLIAKAELLFCKNNPIKALALLESDYENVRTINKGYYNDYLNYMLENAQKYDLKGIEVKYLREAFIHRLFILEKELDRYLELIPKNERAEKLEKLIEEIKSRSKGYHFDKVSILLFRANKLDELVRELSKQNNKFNLIHEIALKKESNHSASFLTIYMKHLAETLRQDSIYAYQVKVFNEAKKFLDTLPKDQVIELIKKLLDQVGKTGHLYRYINEMYEYPFLKEHENF